MNMFVYGDASNATFRPAKRDMHDGNLNSLSWLTFMEEKLRCTN